MDYNKGLNSWCLVLKLLYGWICVSSVHNNGCNNMLPISCDKTLKTYHLKHCAERPLRGAFACDLLFSSKVRSGNVGDAPFPFLAPGALVSRGQRGAGAAAPVSPTAGTLCPRHSRHLCPRHAPPTGPGRQEQQRDSTPPRRWVWGLESAPGGVPASLSSLKAVAGQTINYRRSGWV